VLKQLRAFLQGQPSITQASSFLRLVFALSFGLQLLFATILAAIFYMITTKRSDNPLLAQIMIFLSLAQLPLALFLSQLSAKTGHRQGFLSAAIMSGVLLSTPAWFAAMAFLSTTQTLYIFIFLLILMNYYALGFILCGRWGKLVPTIPSPQKVQSQE
jgi:hypothetical protein